jgi:hypothetical protein
MMDDERDPRYRGTRKDRRRWCRGRPLVSHDWRWVNAQTLPNATSDRRARDPRAHAWRIHERQVCWVCGKYGDRRVRCRWCGVVATQPWWSLLAPSTCASCGAHDEAPQ